MEKKLVLASGTVDDTLGDVLKSTPDAVFYSMNGMVASVLRTGRVVANGCGDAEIYICGGSSKDVVHVKVTQGKGGSPPFPMLISRNNGLPAMYRPDDLVRIPKGTWAYSKRADIYMRVECAEAYNNMAEAAASEGIILRITSAFRSYTDQQVALKRQTERVGYKRAMELGAPAGFSEHQLGLAIDVGGWVDESGEQITMNEDAHIWIENNCYKFGFMLKNPKGKEHITGGIYEPWHIRYIGDLSIAKYVHDKAITLNEYLEEIVM